MQADYFFSTLAGHLKEWLAFFYVITTPSLGAGELCFVCSQAPG